MICDNCKKTIDTENAMHCPECGRQYCKNCGSRLTLCSCYGKVEYYQ